jgi:hypothetical protein
LDAGDGAGRLKLDPTHGREIRLKLDPTHGREIRLKPDPTYKEEGAGIEFDPPPPDKPQDPTPKA